MGQFILFACNSACLIEADNLLIFSRGYSRIFEKPFSSHLHILELTWGHEMQNLR